ncbi:hypothetical protein ABRZ04_06655 [Castellaniella ginsengisoli]
MMLVPSVCYARGNNDSGILLLVLLLPLLAFLLRAWVLLCLTAVPIFVGVYFFDELSLLGLASIAFGSWITWMLFGLKIREWLGKKNGKKDK